MIEMQNLDDFYEDLASVVHDTDEEAVRRVAEMCRSASSHYLQQLLHIAIAKEDLAVIHWLLRYKIDVTHEGRDGHRTIHLAAEFGNPQIIKAVINAGSPVNIVDGRGIGALHMCLEYDHTQAALMLIKEGATVNRPRRYDNGEAPIHVAARLGMNEVLQTIILKGGDASLMSSDKSTPLHLAVSEKHASTVQLLCKAGSNVNACNVKGRTPFHLAAQQVSVEMVRTLLPYVRDLNFPSQEGNTALHFVASAYPPSYSQSEIINLLVSYGADVRCKGDDGRTALHMVAYSGNVTVGEVLIANGAELNVKENVLGETPLNTAAAYDRHDMIRLLLESGADVTVGDKNGQTPLHKLQTVRATRSKYLSTELLLQYGSRVNEVDSRDVTPFEQCIFRLIMNRECREGISILRRLVAAGAQLRPFSGRRSLQHSPFCWLTWHNELEAAAFLVNAGWDLKEEKWLNLPGKNAAMDQFFIRLRQIMREPVRLTCICRKIIRQQASKACDDRDIVPVLEQLPIPPPVKRFLTFETEDDML